MTLCITNQIVHIWLYCACGCSCIQVTSTRRLNSMSSAHEKIGRSQYCDITIYECKNPRCTQIIPCPTITPCPNVTQLPCEQPHGTWESRMPRRSLPLTLRSARAESPSPTSRVPFPENKTTKNRPVPVVARASLLVKVRSLRRDCGSCYPCQCAGSRRCRRSPHHRPGSPATGRTRTRRLP